MSEKRVTNSGSRGVRGSGGNSADSLMRQRRFSAGRKAEAVVRLLRGEDLESLSRELGVAAHELSMWRERFLASGQEALKNRPGDERDEQIRRLKTKVGDLTMDYELLQERLRRTGQPPFTGRRSKR